MFDFIRKPFLWEALDQGLEREIGKTSRFHLKSVQDLAVYAHLKGVTGKSIAEIGGGNSRLLAKLAIENSCFNVEKFAGADGGPAKESIVEGITNVHVFLGERSPLLKPESFDIVFSVSVVEHVPTPDLDAYVEDGIRILRSGGLWLHAIDMYVEDEPSEYWQARYNAYRGWMKHSAFEPVGRIHEGPLRFACDIATNPDDSMYHWGKIAPSLIELRQRAQSVSLLLAARKK